MKSLIIVVLLFPFITNAQTIYQDRIKEKSSVSVVKNVAVPLYKTGEWSAWLRKEGVEYRYRWGLKTQDNRYKTQIDAIYEIRNISKAVWIGAARSLNCQTEQISGFEKRISLKPQEIQTYTFLTPNCGTVDRPFFRSNIVKSVRID